MQTLETRRGQRRHAGLVHPSCLKGSFLSAVTTDPAGAPAGRKTEEDQAGAGEPGGAPLRGDPGGQSPGAALRLMAAHAHPDDESSNGAATMAPYARHGLDPPALTPTRAHRRA